MHILYLSETKQQELSQYTEVECLWKMICKNRTKPIGAATPIGKILNQHNLIT